MAVSDFRSAGLPLPDSCEELAQDADFIREILDRIGGKWSILVMVTLGQGASRYTALERRIPGLSQRMLTLTLKHLVRDGLIVRTAFAEVPPRVEYSLAPLGTTLLSAVRALSDWAVAHHAEVRGNRERYDEAVDRIRSK